MFILTTPNVYVFFFFFFNDTATTEIYTLSLHDALPILRKRQPSRKKETGPRRLRLTPDRESQSAADLLRDRKSTRLNSSHSQISYAVFCLKKKKKNKTTQYLLDTELEIEIRI